MDNATREALEAFRVSNRKPPEAAATLPEDAPMKIPGPIQVENFPGGDFKPEPAEDTPEMLKLKSLFGGYSIPTPNVAGPAIVYPAEIDDKESGAIDTLDRVLALNVGDPSGSYNTLKNKYGPKGYEFSQSTEGDILFKSPKAPKWSRLDPGTRDTNSITSLGGLAPNKMYDGSPAEFGRDVADVAPDIAQGVTTGALSSAGALAGAGSGLLTGSPISGARFGMSVGAGLGGALGEVTRQTAGKLTGFREAPFDWSRVATQAGVDALLGNLIGGGASKKQIEDAMTRSGFSFGGQKITDMAKVPDAGVTLLNANSRGLTDPKLPPELLPDATNQFRQDTSGLLSNIGSWLWGKVDRIPSNVKERAFKPIKDTALEFLEKSGVKFGLGVKPPKTLADAAPYVSTQGRAGKMVEYIAKTAKEAYDTNLEKAGTEINTALGKLKEPIDLSSEREIFDNAILDLESKKLRDPLQATQADKTIAALKEARGRIFGAPEENLPLEELRKKALEGLQAKALKGNIPENRLGDMLYSTPEAAIGRQNEVLKAVNSMSPEEQYAAAGLPIPRDVMGTPMTPPPLPEDARKRLLETTYFKMFTTPKPKDEGSIKIPEGLDRASAKMWATAKVKKMTRSELLEAANQLPQRNAGVDPDIAWDKFRTLKQMAGYRSGDDPDLVKEGVQRVATAAERSLSTKIYAKLNDVAGKDLKNQYKIYLEGEGDVPKLIANINAGLSTAGKAFLDTKGHILTAIKEYDDLYGTKIADQLEVLAVAKDFGTKGEWFPQSVAGATSTGAIIEGGNMGKTAANLAGNLMGLGPGALQTAENIGQVVGSSAGSSAVTRGAARVGRAVDKAYDKLGGDRNPISTRQMITSPWMNLENTDQNKKLLREREKG